MQIHLILYHVVLDYYIVSKIVSPNQAWFYIVLISLVWNTLL